MAQPTEGGFEEVETLREGPEVYAKIHRKKGASGKVYYHVLFQREFADSGKLKATSWLGKRHLEAMQKLIDRVRVYFKDLH